jgi:hypothetical protein
VPVIDRTRQRDGFFTRDAFRYAAEAVAYHLQLLAKKAAPA